MVGVSGGEGGGVFWFEDSQKAAGKMRAVYLCCDGLGVAIKRWFCVYVSRPHAHWSKCQGVYQWPEMRPIEAGFIGLRGRSLSAMFFLVGLGAILPYAIVGNLVCSSICFHTSDKLVCLDHEWSSALALWLHRYMR